MFNLCNFYAHNTTFLSYYVVNFCDIVWWYFYFHKNSSDIAIKKCSFKNATLLEKNDVLCMYGTLLENQSKFPQYNMKCSGETWY